MLEHNFKFLENEFPSLALLGCKAEEYVFSDSNASLIKTGMLCESIVNNIYERNHLIPPPKDQDNFAGRTRYLNLDGYLTREQKVIIDKIRTVRNLAAHKGFSSIAVAKLELEAAHGIAQWFMMVYGKENYEAKKFNPPKENINSNPEISSISSKAEEKLREDTLIKQDLLKAKNVPAPNADEIKKRSIRAENQRPKNEAETRILIDEQLRAVGWEVDSEELKYSRGTRPQKGRNIAISEWPTKPVTKQNKDECRADYALFIGEKLYAFVEAKSMHKDIPTVIDNQCKDYSSNVRDEDHDYVIDDFGKYQVPFTFAANGRPYLKEYEQKSGIWFLDLRHTNCAPKALKGWMSPNGLQELYEKGINEDFRLLKSEPYDVLLNQSGLNLRYYQIDAIKAVEDSISKGQEKILLSMATGTGKTRTILGLIYRVLKANIFKRILYLVDRNSLGEQTADVFKDVELEDNMPLDKIYNINYLKDAAIDKSTKVQVATVQSMVKRVLYYSETNTPMPGVNDFDLIIIDEAHRGYILDKEMSDEEAIYSDQLDFQSKYRSVVDYFTGVKVALTATPALHTVNIFGDPVYNYSYRQAVLDGNLVDFDAPHIIKTNLSSEGIHYKKGEEVKVYDSQTNNIVNFKLPDELDFDVEQFNKKIITRSFNQTVLEEISKDIDPTSPDIYGKTLIYAVNDAHADMVVDILKDIYTKQGVDNDAIIKITGSTSDGNQKKIQEIIRKFKNENLPSIVVTVDLLTTGIDVPSITKLVFLRCVKSRILYEQMIGRATRLCSDIKKDHFEIYDAVGITNSLADFTTMKPIVASPNESISNLYDKLKNSKDVKEIEFHIENILGKLQRKFKRMDDHAKSNFSNLSGGVAPFEFIDRIKAHKDSNQAKLFLIENEALLKKIDAIKSKSDNQLVIVSEKDDSLKEHSRSYGEKYDKPEDYIEAFNKYIKDNKEKIEMLNLVCTRPSKLTRQSLRELLSTLELEGFTKKQLLSAIKSVNKSNDEISADITTIIRNVALGEPLISHAEKIEAAFKKLKSKYQFSKQQNSWLERFKKYLLSEEETVLDVIVLDEDNRFKSRGGYKIIDNCFSNKLDGYFKELNSYIYNEIGNKI